MPNDTTEQDAKNALFERYDHLYAALDASADAANWTAYDGQNHDLGLLVVELDAAFGTGLLDHFHHARATDQSMTLAEYGPAWIASGAMRDRRQTV
jgi:hypothetical protein